MTSTTGSISEPPQETTHGRMNPRVSVIAPCFNEEGNLPELVQRLDATFRRGSLNGEIVLVNDGSTDNSAAVLHSLSKQFPCVVAVNHVKNAGIEAAWRTGIQASHGEYVCLIDSDLQNLPEDVLRLYQEIEFSNADIVQGYRSSIGRKRDSRYLLSRGLNLFLNSLFRMRLRDNKSGFLIGRREVIADSLRHRLHYRYFQSFITVSAASRGYSIREVETIFAQRLVGKSFMSGFPVRVIQAVFVDLIKAFYEFRLAPKQEQSLDEFLKANPAPRHDEPLKGWRRLLLEVYFLSMPLHKWMITRRARRYYMELKESQWLSPAQIEQIQLSKLQAIVNHAYFHVPYYRDAMKKAGVHPADIRELRDLEKIPLLSKSDVRENLYFGILSDNYDKSKVLKVSTSGSTGEPFVCYADQHQLEIRWAATQRSMEWTGYRFGDRQARLWHQTLGMTFIQAARERIDAWFNRRLFIPAFEMSDESIEKFVKKLMHHQPVLIDGYAECFNFLAHYLKNNPKISLHPKAIVSSAQVLPEQSRKIISFSFGCEIFDKYGSREFSGLAYECSAHSGHHVVAESYIVELLKDGRPAKPGETGEVVVTDLNNRCMPLLRYRLGDLAVALDNSAACSCGRGLPRIGNIEGRVQAIIVGSNGRYLPGTFFAHFFKDFDFLVRQYQVLQEVKGEVQLKIIKGSRFNEKGFDEMLQTLRGYLGQDTQINVEFLDVIPMVRTGKHQGSISRLTFDFQSSAPTL